MAAYLYLQDDKGLSSERHSHKSLNKSRAHSKTKLKKKEHDEKKKPVRRGNIQEENHIDIILARERYKIGEGEGGDPLNDPMEEAFRALGRQHRNPKAARTAAGRRGNIYENNPRAGGDFMTFNSGGTYVGSDESKETSDEELFGEDPIEKMLKKQANAREHHGQYPDSPKGKQTDTTSKLSPVKEQTEDQVKGSEDEQSNESDADDELDVSKSTTSRGPNNKQGRKGVLDNVFNFEDLKKPRTHDGLKKRIQ